MINLSDNSERGVFLVNWCGPATPSARGVHSMATGKKPKSHLRYDPFGDDSPTKEYAMPDLLKAQRSMGDTGGTIDDLEIITRSAVESDGMPEVIMIARAKDDGGWLFRRFAHMPEARTDALDDIFNLVTGPDEKPGDWECPEQVVNAVREFVLGRPSADAKVARSIFDCASAWPPGTRLVGAVTAKEVVDFVKASSRHLACRDAQSESLGLLLEDYNVIRRELAEIRTGAGSVDTSVATCDESDLSVLQQRVQTLEGFLTSVLTDSNEEGARLQAAEALRDLGAKVMDNGDIWLPPACGPKESDGS